MVAKVHLTKGYDPPSRGFLKWWYPQIIHFNRVFHYKPSILGYPYFRKPPSRVTCRVNDLSKGILASARFMVAAGGLESGLNTAVNAVPLAEMVGGWVRNAWENLCFFVFCTQMCGTVYHLWSTTPYSILAKHVTGWMFCDISERFAVFLPIHV